MEALPKKQVSEFEDHVFSIGNQRILKVSSIYGPNGGGKSNLLEAIKVFVSAALGDSITIRREKKEINLTSIFSDSKSSKITIYFVTDHFEIGYSLDLGFQLNENRNNFSIIGFSNVVPIINEEEMIYRYFDDKDFHRLFIRNSDGEISSNNLDELSFLTNDLFLSKERSLISFVYQNYSVNAKSKENDSTKVIFELINDLMSIVFIDGYRVTHSDVFYGNYYKSITKNKEKIISFFNAANIDIDDIKVEKISNEQKIIYFGRNNSSNSKINWLPVGSESLGTRKYFDIIMRLMIHKSGIFLADDFDSFFHPKLIRAILDLFHSKDNVNKQFIFNSHDLINMDCDVFRRDEIWFSYRDDSYTSHLTSLANIVNYKGEMVRKDAKYGKQYLEGRYGADPFIKKGLNW